MLIINKRDTRDILFILNIKFLHQKKMPTRFEWANVVKKYIYLTIIFLINELPFSSVILIIYNPGFRQPRSSDTLPVT